MGAVFVLGVVIVVAALAVIGTGVYRGHKAVIEGPFGPFRGYIYTPYRGIKGALAP